jgi:hypothetical protein
MGKKMVISEEQLKKIMEFKVNELNLIDVAKQLKSLPCTGESMKNLILNKLTELGYQNIKVNFIGHEEETNNLMYSVYTDGPMFVVKTQSSNTGQPCLEIIYVQAYDKV